MIQAAFYALRWTAPQVPGNRKSWMLMLILSVAAWGWHDAGAQEGGGDHIPDAAAIVDIVDGAIAAGLPDCRGATFCIGTARITTTVTDAQGAPPLPTRLSTMQSTIGGGVSYTFEIGGLHAHLADGAWWLGLQYRLIPDSKVKVDTTACRMISLATLSADAEAAHPFVRKSIASWLELVPAAGREAAATVMAHTVPETYLLKLNQDDLPLAVVALTRGGYADAPWLAHAIALIRSRAYWSLRYWWPEDLPFDPTGSYHDEQALVDAWRSGNPTFPPEPAPVALRRALHRLYRQWIMSPERSRVLDTRAAAKAAIATLDPHDPQHRKAGIEALLAASALPGAVPENASLVERLRSWTAPSQARRRFRVSGGGTTMGTSIIEDVPTYVPKAADIPALIILIGDERPSRWIDFSGSRCVGDNALRAIAVLLKEDPRIHGGVAGPVPWGSKERATTEAALRTWWAQAHKNPPASP